MKHAVFENIINKLPVYPITDSDVDGELSPKLYPHLLTEIPKHMDETNTDFSEDLLPRSEKLPGEYHKKI